MRKIIVSTFLTMDGVLQAPGGPHEDPTNNFKWGGWSFHYWDDIMNEAMGGIMSESYDLLLGRRTYEIFAAYWPFQENHPIGVAFTRAQKFVVATTAVDLSWENSTLITGDVVKELKRLKATDGPDLFVNGSGRLIQTLLQHDLVDALHTWIFPITLGRGKKLFEDGIQPRQWKLTKSVVSTTGVVIASYVPDGEVKIGSFPSDEVSEAEIARRAKWASGK
jgi:dihydrofolate reductase